MPWCPSCKLEYVKGISVCPDCKSALVDSLDEIQDSDSMEMIEDYSDNYTDPDEPDEETKREMILRMKQFIDNPVYRSKKEAYDENKSGAYVLTICGLIGLAVLVLNAAGIVNLPLSGFSLTLTYVVMGCLFFVFLVSGIRSYIKMKTLKDEVVKEQENIELALDFIKSQVASGMYVIPEDEIYEEAYLRISDKAVNDIKNKFPEFEPGFAFFVFDRYGSDLIDEN